MKDSISLKIQFFCLIVLLTAFALTACSINQQRETLADEAEKQRLDAIYQVTSPELSEEEYKAKLEVAQWLAQSTDFSHELREDIAEVFIRCARFDQHSESARIISVTELEADLLWKRYSLQSNYGDTYTVTIDIDSNPNEVKFLTKDNTLLYAESIP